VSLWQLCGGCYADTVMKDDRAAIRSLVGEGSPLDRLAALSRLRSSIDVMTSELITELRDEHVSWARIGQALGVTAQAAQQRVRRPL
jgi:hypothetical protein